MSKKISILVGTVMFLLADPVSSLSSTNCEQTFKLLGLNWRASKVFWIAEDLSGECQSSRILQVILSDSGSTTIHTYLRKLHDWNWLSGGMETEEPTLFVNEGGSWVSPGIGLRIKVPSPDSSFLQSFQRHVFDGGSNGQSWNSKLGSRGISLPKIEGIETRFVYYYPPGLYVNYTLSNAYFFPEAGFLLIFTNQQIRAVGNDTMHGFLIFKTKQ